MGPFLQTPLPAAADSLQHTVLEANTILLIASLIVVELMYSDVPKEQRRHLRYFYPVVAALVGILVYTIITQAGKA